MSAPIDALEFGAMSDAQLQALLAAARLELQRVVPALPATGLCVLEAAAPAGTPLGEN